MNNKGWIILLLAIIIVMLGGCTMLGGLAFWGWSQKSVECAQWGPAELAPEPGKPKVEPVVVPTFTPEPSVPVMPPSEDKAAFVPYESEGGVPYSGGRLSIDVAPDEIEVVTAGPACIFGVCLPGGEKRGSVILMLGGNEEVVSYTITGLIAGANWHASYRPFDNPLDESIWRALANDRVEAMQIAPNCTDGKGCDVIDILVVDEDGIIDQWVVGK